MPLGVYLLSSDNPEINAATELVEASFFMLLMSGV
jgi:hypothetical protein